MTTAQMLANEALDDFWRASRAIRNLQNEERLAAATGRIAHARRLRFERNEVWAPRLYQAKLYLDRSGAIDVATGRPKHAQAKASAA